VQTIHLEDAVGRIPDGASLAIGGFMAVGTPERLIDELVRQQLVVGFGRHGSPPLGC
jgi:acetate CoA/acetoacetate CoA-transferase alpha subunit